MSCEELIVLVRRQGEQINSQDRQINAMAGQVSELMEANEALAGKLARLEHLLSRNSECCARGHRWPRSGRCCGTAGH